MICHLEVVVMEEDLVVVVDLEMVVLDLVVLDQVMDLVLECRHCLCLFRDSCCK